MDSPSKLMEAEREKHLQSLLEYDHDKEMRAEREKETRIKSRIETLVVERRKPGPKPKLQHLSSHQVSKAILHILKTLGFEGAKIDSRGLTLIKDFRCVDGFDYGSDIVWERRLADAMISLGLPINPNSSIQGLAREYIKLQESKKVGVK